MTRRFDGYVNENYGLCQHCIYSTSKALWGVDR